MAAINGGPIRSPLTSTGMIFQVGDVISRNKRVDTPLKFNKISWKIMGLKDDPASHYGMMVIISFHYGVDDLPTIYLISTGILTIPTTH